MISLLKYIFLSKTVKGFIKKVAPIVTNELAEVIQIFMQNYKQNIKNKRLEKKESKNVQLHSQNIHNSKPKIKDSGLRLVVNRERI